MVNRDNSSAGLTISSMAGDVTVSAAGGGILTLIYPFTQTEAAAITLVDRAISVFSIWFTGGLIYALSSKTKANVTRRPAEVAPGS